MTIIASACWGTDQYREQILWDRRVVTVVVRCRINGKCELSGFQVRNFEIPPEPLQKFSWSFTDLFSSTPSPVSDSVSIKESSSTYCTSYLIDLNLLWELVSSIDQSEINWSCCTRSCSFFSCSIRPLLTAVQLSSNVFGSPIVKHCEKFCGGYRLIAYPPRRTTLFRSLNTFGHKSLEKHKYSLRWRQKRNRKIRLKEAAASKD